MIIQNKIISEIILSICCLSVIGCSFLSANAQQPIPNHFPILLVHGYAEDSSIWNPWINWLAADNFSKVYTITFQNDRCGSVVQHAVELKNMVDRILSETGSQKINIIAHSKGGLDARLYISSSILDKVANLIMIATPNSGTPAAYGDFTGCPVGSDSDLFPGSTATQVVDKPQSTSYYTVTGDWLPYDLCFAPLNNGGSCFIPGHDDGLVPVYSAQSSPSYTYTSLGIFPYDHMQIVQQKDVYEKVLPILNR